MIENLEKFTTDQIRAVNDSVALAEELVSEYYKMSASQWLRRKYDVKTLVDLSPEEIVHGPFAQIIRYKGHQKNKALESSTYDFYKICLQDHFIISALRKFAHLKLPPFTLYIVVHELIHIVRFSMFIQNFEASQKETLAEETRVHEYTHKILSPVRFSGMTEVLRFYDNWRKPFDALRNT